MSNNPPQLSDSEKRKIVIDTLQNDFRLPGEKLRILSRTLDLSGKSLNAVEAVEIATILVEDTIAGVVAAEAASAASFIGAILVPVTGTLEIVQSYDEDIRLYAMRSIAYTITAWAFGDSVPKKSAIILETYVKG